VQQSLQRLQWHSGSYAATAPVKAAAKAAAPAKVAVPANLAAPAKRQLRSRRNSKVSSGSGSASEDGRNGSSASEEGIDLGRMANLKLVDKRGKELVKLNLKVLA
jgi:hypothetical protein